MSPGDGFILEAEALTRRYGRRTIVDVAELQVRDGEVLAILGPNGSGKSTLFRMLCLVERPDSGRIRVGGLAADTSSELARRRIAAVFQQPFLFAGSVRSNIEIGLRAQGIDASERDRRVAAILQALQLTDLEHADVRTLSAGEAQRAALARALVLQSDLLLLDEPTAVLDVTVRARFREDLSRLLRARRGAALLITHDAVDAYALADRVAVMQEGAIVQTGTPEDLVLSPATPFVAAFTGAELLLDGTVAELDGQLARVALAGGADLWCARSAGAAVLRVGGAAHVAYRPEDVGLAAAVSAEVSAQNQLAMRVEAMIPAGSLVRVRLRGGVPLSAVVTRRAVESLALAPGVAVVAIIKAAALRAFAAD